MNKNPEVAILDFGSSKVTVLISERGVNNTFNVRGVGECDYEGFCDGKFLEPEMLKTVITSAVRQAESKARVKISHLYVGVPGEFTTVVCRESSVNYKQRQRITDAEIDGLFDAADIFKNHARYMVVNRAPIYFMLDDNRRITSLANVYSTKLSGLLSYVLMERKFKDDIGRILVEIVPSAEFVSSCLAEALFLFEPEARDRYALLVDVGHITTSVMLIRGDGILFLKSFSVGGGHVSADLSQCLEIPYLQADALKRKVALSVQLSPEDVYTIQSKEEVKEFNSQTVHDIIEARVESIGENIRQCLAECDYEIPAHLTLNITGGGLSYIRGAKEIISKCVKRPVDVIISSKPTVNKPEMSSPYGVLDLALDNTAEAAKPSFLQKLFGKKD